jgi:hypothetical protein
MIFPDRDEDLERRVIWLVERCKESLRDRVQVYDRRERYFLFGTNGNDQVRYNRIESHIDLVSSFLYAPDHAFYNIAAQRNASDEAIRQATALQDEFNDDFQDVGLSDAFAEAIPWACTYNTMIFKQGWNDTRGEATVTLIPPHQFGVFREDLTSLDDQEAFVHTYALEYHDAVNRLVRAGRASEIPRMAIINQPFESPFPEMLTRMIIAGTGGVNLQGNILGQINPEYTPTDTYQPQTQHPMVMFNELCAWDSETSDYRFFHVVDPDILIGDSRKTIKAMLSVPRLKDAMEKKAKRVARRRREAEPDEPPGEDDFAISQSNLFLPGDHPFTKVQPYRKYNYFWGKAHIDSLMALQDWMNERFEQIDEILDRQAYPPKVGTGFGGLTDEKMEAFGAADTWLLDQMPNAKLELLKPDMPEDMFAELKEIGVFFLEASGLTEVVAGKGESGVRSRQHAQQLKQTGSGRIKRAALALEPSLVRIGDIGLKLKMRNDDQPIIPEPVEGKDGKEISEPFLPAQLSTEVKIRISGHAHSPLFVDDAREMAVLMKKVGAIDNEMFVRMMHPPNQDAIIHAQRAQARKQRQMIMSLPPEERIKLISGGGRRGRK